MKYARIVNENGGSQSNNYMLDDVMDILNRVGISNEDPKNDELIKKLTIDKIEYARRCMAQITAQGDIESYKKIDNALQEKIIDLEGKPTV
jgi:hypothetical protein